MNLIKKVNIEFLKISFFSILMFSLLSFSSKASDNLPGRPDDRTKVKTGSASFYANFFVGRKTANGEIFSQEKLTCASNVYPLGTWLRVTHAKNGKSVIVKVNDRMHPRMKRVVDLSKLAAKELGMIAAGVVQVKVESLGKKKPKASM
jgi:rare lipoprotein A